MRFAEPISWAFAAFVVTLYSPAARADEVSTDLELTCAEDTEVSGALTPLAKPTAKHVLKTKPAHGSVTLSADGFVYTPAKNYAGDDAFSIDALKVAMHVTPVNDAPTASALALTTNEDTAVSGTVVAADFDKDPLSYQLASPPSHGEATVDAKTGKLTFTPAPDYTGADVLTIEASDGQLSARSEVKITVTAVNDAPVAKAAALSVDEDAKLDGSLEAVDVDSATLTFRVTAKPQHGSMTLSPKGAFTYVPAHDFRGSDTFSYEASDGQLGATAAVGLTINSVNDAPVSKPLALTSAEDTAVSGAIVATDVDGDALTYTLKGSPAHGETTVDAKSGRVTYTPAANYAGADVFSIEVGDGQATATTEVKVTLTPVNDPPVAKAAALTGDEDHAVKGTLEASDLDSATLTYRLTKKPKHGELTLDAKSGAFSYAPALNSHGIDELSIEVSDGALTAEAAITLTLVAVNDAPVAKALTLTTPEDTATSAAVLASDVDGDALSYQLKTPAAHGEATVDAKSGKVAYTPALNFNGADGFVVEVSDGALSATAQVKVDVSAVNDAPVTHVASLSVDEDTKLTGALEATDVDDATLTYRVAVPPKHGEVTLMPSGTFTFTPARDFHGADELSFEVSDGKLTARNLLKLTVRAVNDAPAVKPLTLSTAEDTAVKSAALASDVDGDALSYSVKTPAAHGEVTVDAKSGQLRFAPAHDFNGADGFVLEVTDGQQPVELPVKVAISAVNDAPVASSGAFSGNEDTKLEGTVTVSDVERDALTIRVNAKPKHGELTLNAQTGAFSYAPARDYHGADSFTFDVADASLKSSLATVELTVASVNDAPVTQPLSLSTAEDTTVRGAVIASDVDRDGLTYRIATAATHGTATVDARSGAVSYSPGADFNGPDAFVVEIADGTTTVSCAATVSISAVPDLPRIAAAALEGSEDQVAEGRLPGSDADGDKLTFHLLSAAHLGDAVLVDASTGAVRFTPRHDLNGDDEVAFDVSDGVTTVKGVMKIRIAPVNDAPLLANLDLKTIEDRLGEEKLVGTDVDGDTLTYTLLEAPRLGKALVEPSTGNVRFAPPKDQHGQTSFMVVVSDGTAKSAPAEVRVTIEPQNDAPVASSGSFTGDEDVDVRGTLVASDVDGDALVFSVAVAPAHGSVLMLDAAQGAFLYTPAANYSGSDEFRFAATDSGGLSSINSVRLEVRAVDDAPVAMPDTMTAPASGSVTGQLRGYDRESKRVTFRIVDQPSSGKVKLVNERTGDFVFTAEGISARQVAFKFVVFDGALISEPTEVVLDIRSRSF